MVTIDLNRRFHEWKAGERPDPEMLRTWGLDDGGLGWPELLKKRRVVVLAEAGSGKSTEFAEQARVMGLNQLYVFHASLDDVGRDGLETSLPANVRTKLDAWRRGTEEAWFFLDSIDEAKVGGIKFERVVRNVADGIHGAEDRCFVFLSGRATDWELQRDSESLKRWLLAPSAISKPRVTPEEELLQIVRNERTASENSPSVEEPFVGVMGQLDRERVRVFAKARETARTEEFLKAIDDADLWHFASRPLDLDWLVRFWQSQGRLGSLRDMVERSIAERLKESNLDRTQAADLSAIAALKAAERIGAAMVFGRITTIAIPDRDATLSNEVSLRLEDILPDWSGDDRNRLLTRPVFDPATLGRVRFHNDNDGTVRSYLTARWLVRLRSENLPTSTLFRLLFAKSYGLEVIKPSLNETVAWLCLWDKDVVTEVIKRAPSLLLSAGDPASLSAGARSAALTRLLAEATSGDQEWPWWDNDKLRRFAQSDLGEAVLSLWPQYRGHKEAARLLMRLIWLGPLTVCGPLARDVAFDDAEDPQLRTFAGKALLAVADASTRINYAALIRERPSGLPIRMVRDAIIEFFPGLVSVSETLRIVSDLHVANGYDEFDIERDGVVLASRLDKPAEIEAFLAGLLVELDGEIKEHAHYPLSKREESLFPAIAECALRLLHRVSADSAPDAAIDAALRISNRREASSSIGKTASAVFAELHRTPERRRRAFWHVATAIRAATPARPVDHPWHLEFSGYLAGLTTDDVDWLLTDGLSKGGADCKLAVNAALAVYQGQGQLPAVLAKLTKAAEADRVAQQVVDEWRTRPFASEWELESHRTLQELQAQNKAETDKRDQSWIDFIRNLRSDAQRIAKLKLPAPLDRRSDLMDVWQLLHGATNRSRYGVDSVAPLERIAGTEIATAAAEGLIAHWRLCTPLVRSGRSPEQRNSVRWIDLMGLAGLTLEASKTPPWATKLSAEEARRATEYSTLEINGFPRWLSEVVTSHPTEVRAVLQHEINDELSREGVPFETLQAVSYSNDSIIELLAPALFETLESDLILPESAVRQILQILVRGLAGPERDRFENLALSKFERDNADDMASVLHLAAAFAVNPASATAVLVRKAKDLDETAQAKLVDRFLTACFGDPSLRGGFKAVVEPSAKVIEDLMMLSFKTHGQVAARQRPAGVVYRTGNDDYADQARDAVFSRFVKSPGAATFQALLRLQQDASCPVAPSRLRALAEERAQEDSESAPWPPGEAFAFEQSAETSPLTGLDLRTVVIGRIEDMQHDLLHSDFSQGQTLKRLTPEREVQKWVADRLRVKQGRSYSVEREPSVVDEKEPDVRIRAKATDAHVAIEIKVAESWTLAKLDEALEVQLCGRYLRNDHGRHGILLLVYQHTRPHGWEDKVNCTDLTFAEVVTRLRQRALAISSERHNAPQPEITVLDVSSC